MFLTDAQIHVWAADRPDRPWAPGGADYSHGDELGTDHVLAEMDRVGVDRAILVPPSWEGERNDVVAAAVEAHPDRFRMMARFKIEDPSERDRIPGLVADPSTLGVRLIYISRSEGWLRDGTSDWFWPIAEDLGINIMIFAPDQYEILGEVAERHPGLTLSLCHVGLAESTRNEEIRAHAERAAKLARFPNVSVKATSLPTYVDEPYPFPTLHDPLKILLESFGPERVFWGSDLSRLSCDYAELRDLFTEELDFLDRDELELVMGRGVCEWFGWPVTAAEA